MMLDSQRTNNSVTVLETFVVVQVELIVTEDNILKIYDVRFSAY
jgi:hypothetical protein